MTVRDPRPDDIVLSDTGWMRVGDGMPMKFVPSEQSDHKTFQPIPAEPKTERELALEAEVEKWRKIGHDISFDAKALLDALEIENDSDIEGKYENLTMSLQAYKSACEAMSDGRKRIAIQSEQKGK